jgi:hypothetical protein
MYQESTSTHIAIEISIKELIGIPSDPQPLDTKGITTMNTGGIATKNQGGNDLKTGLGILHPLPSVFPLKWMRMV